MIRSYFGKPGMRAACLGKSGFDLLFAIVRASGTFSSSLGDMKPQVVATVLLPGVGKKITVPADQDALSVVPH